MSKSTETKSEVKTNRYTILDAEIKRISKELKAKKQEMLKAIKTAEAEYRAYRKEVYAPARKAAFDTFKASKVIGTKPKTEKVKTEKSAKPKASKPAKKVEVQKTVTGTDKTAAECIAVGEAAIAKAKAAAAVNKRPTKAK